MTSATVRTTLVGAALLVSACSFSEEALWPSLTGEDPAGEATTENMATATNGQATIPAAAQPSLGNSSFDPVNVTPGTPTGTFVGEKVVELRGELQSLQGAIAQHNQILQEVRAKIVGDSQRYHNTVAAMNARLQVGTTPGNPILVQQFNNAQVDLDHVESDIDIMNQLAQAVSTDATMSAFLAESAHAAFDVSGAVDEDHVQLAILEDEVNRTVVLIERLLKEVSSDVRRQTAYVSTERSNLNLLSAGIKSGEIYGVSLVNQAMASAAGGSNNLAGQPVDTTGRRPLVVIRFDRNNVPYEQALYNAVSKVLEQRPSALFDLVAVAPASGDEATIALNSSKSRRHAENVLRSLVDMGLPPSRIAISGKTADNANVNEVRLYLR
ncbi:MAG: hypothetical protein HN644_08685 [Rhodospirillales bacterium]|jgi:hypothetical protein|nr:hypothetical protein [Rhodospirillales bacterium]MBT4039853.1 hypothetical protein [Rhodospirillales bacterium]MBT4627485.1 hypothetical protein [Rhodospirillales bacterium]MBT5350985.1 hypothetical protein [Rhodospirillales bacterium]MBT6111370.1 hypothetical protein [Rhodospirillales bacterium]